MAGNDSPATKQWQSEFNASIEQIAVKDGTIYTIFKNNGVNLHALETIDAASRDSEWRFEAGEWIKSLAVEQKTVYVASDRTLYAVGVDNGITEWDFEADGNIYDLAVKNGIAYLGLSDPTSGEYAVDALDLITHQRRWRFNTDDLVLSLAVEDGTTYAGCSSGILHAVNADDGIEQWRLKDSGEVWSIAAENDCVYAGNADGGLYRIDAKTGNSQWRFSADPSDSRAGISDIIITEDTIYLACQDYSLYAIDADDGHCKWIFKIGSPVHTLAIDEKTIYAGSSSSRGNFLYALEIAASKSGDVQRSNHPISQADKDASDHATEESRSNTKIYRDTSACPECDTDLSEYGSVSFCPECGSEL